MSALSHPRTDGTAAHRVFSIVVGAVGILLIGGFCARLAVSSHYGKAAIEALIAIPVLFYVARRPAVAVLVLLLVAASTFAYGVLPRANLPGHPPINLADLLLAAAVGGTLWRRPWVGWPRIVKRYFLFLALMLALAAIATVKTAVLGPSQSRDALFEYRNWLYLGVAFTIALELRGELWRPLLNGLIAVASLVSLIAIAAAAVPSFAHTLQSVSPTTVFSPTAVNLSGGVDVGNTARIRVQGLFFIYSMLIPTIAMTLVLKDRWRTLRIGAVLLMIAAIAVSLNRNMYTGTVVGILVMALLGGAMVRFRISMIILAIVASLALVTLSSVTPAITSEVGKRAGTILAPSQVLGSNSAQDRAYELSFALPSIARHPWTGVGPRQSYGALRSPFNPTPRFFVQNLYIFLATDYGIPTALAFLLLPILCLGFGVSRVRHARDPVDRALLAGTIGSLVALLLSCSVDTFLQDPSSTVAFGVLCGLLLAAGLRTLSSQTNRGAVGV